MKNLPLLATSYLLSNFGAQILTIGLAFESFKNAGNGELAGLILMLHYLPGGIISLFGGSFANKLGLKKSLALNNIIILVMTTLLFYQSPFGHNLLFYIALFFKNFSHQYINILKGSAIKYAFNKNQAKLYGSKIQIGYTIGSMLAGLCFILVHEQLNYHLLLMLNLVSNFFTLILMAQVKFEENPAKIKSETLRTELSSAIKQIMNHRYLFESFMLSILSVGLIQGPLFFYRNILAEGLWKLGSDSMGMLHLVSTIGITLGLFLYKKFLTMTTISRSLELKLISLFNILLLTTLISPFSAGIVIILILGAIFEIVYMHFFMETLIHAPHENANTILCLRAGLAQASAGIASYLLGMINTGYLIYESMLMTVMISTGVFLLFYLIASGLRRHLFNFDFFDRRRQTIIVADCRRKL